MPKKAKLPYITDRRIVVPFIVLQCQAYRSLSPKARALMTLLQMYWFNNKPTDMGVRQAAEYLNISIGTAGKAFAELEHAKFITVDSFSYRNISKGINLTKSYILNWMPYEYKPPSCKFLTEHEMSKVSFGKLKIR